MSVTSLPTSMLADWFRGPTRALVGLWKNIRSGTQIDYRDVALKARFGRGVAVMSRTRIDEFCEIGAYSYVGYQCFISRASIGPYASIANNVSIGPGEHDLTRISTSGQFSRGDVFDELTSKPLTIGPDVWIGVDAIVRRGITVGTGAVIGANSFVTQDVPPFAVVAGSPARLIKFRFNEAQQHLILQSLWWTKTPDEARPILEKLQHGFESHS